MSDECRSWDGWGQHRTTCWGHSWGKGFSEKNLFWATRENCSTSRPRLRAFDCFISLWVCLFIFFPISKGIFQFPKSPSGRQMVPQSIVPAPVWTYPGLEAAIHRSCNRRIPIFQFFFFFLNFLGGWGPLLKQLLHLLKSLSFLLKKKIPSKCLTVKRRRLCNLSLLLTGLHCWRRLVPLCVSLAHRNGFNLTARLL